MPLEISEDLVSLAYQSLGYFVIEGRQVGHGEIDLLGVRLGRDGQIERRVHIEVQIGVNPIGALGGKGWNLARANREPVAGAKEWIKRKYKGKIEEAVVAAFGGKRPDRVFVHGVMKKPVQLDTFRSEGIECVPIGELLKEAMMERQRNRLHRAVAIARMLVAGQEASSCPTGHDKVGVSDSR